MGPFDSIIFPQFNCIYIYILYCIYDMSCALAFFNTTNLDHSNSLTSKTAGSNPLPGLGRLSWNPQDNIQAIRALGGSGQYNDHTEFEGTELLSFVPGRVCLLPSRLGYTKRTLFSGMWLTKKHGNFSDFEFFDISFQRASCGYFLGGEENAMIF